MHVGINLIYLVPGETGGTETYAVELIPEMRRVSPGSRFTAFVNQETAAALPSLEWLRGLEVVTVPVSARSRVQWVRGEQQLLPPLAERAGVDLVHSLANTGPVRGSFKRVVTVHDIHFKLVPEAHSRVMRLGMSVLVPLTARRSDRVITDARSTADELCEHLGLARSKIDPVPLGIGSLARTTPLAEAQVRDRFMLGERPIVLCVASKRPHKNLVRLISALALIAAESRPTLVIPGYSTSHDNELRAHAAALGVETDLCLLSWVSAEELEGLYSAAECLVCPSLHEGFGLPVLEAMARGVPVACSGRGALREVADGAAVLFDPLESDSIATAIGHLVSDPKIAARCRAAGLQRAKRYTWHATAEGTLTTYVTALGAAEPH